tara:strand:- start:1422 stop:2375 length:954 start_codon:yes stop_codon:yes gene_type:complete
MVKIRLYFDEKKKKWLECPTKKWKEWQEETGHLTINLHNRLREKLDNIKKIVKRKWDAVFLIDGHERIGKSTLGMTAAWYLSDAKLTIDNFASGMTDAAEKAEKLPDKSILFVDEGSLVFNSKDSMTREAKKLQKVLDVIGQKNMIFIIVLPSFFDLNKNIATRRSKFLLHVYTASDMKRGRFTYFGPNKKRHLYALGKKNFGSYTKPKSDWLGNFDDFHLPFDEEYIKLKKKSLHEALAGDAKGDGKIRMGLFRAMYVQRVVAKLKDRIPMVDMAKAFGIGTGVFYRDLECEIPEEIKTMNANKRVKVVADNTEQK